MCNPASMIITRRHRAHWSENTDSHHEIISEFGLRETDARGNINIVPVEITPPGGDLTKPISKWKFRIDVNGYQRELPVWWDNAKGEASARCALKEWKSKKVITHNTKELNIGQFYVCGKANIISVGGTARIIVGGSAVIQDVSGSAVIQGVTS